MSGFSPEVRQAVLCRAGWRCERCGGLPVDALHHRAPRGMGGTSREWVNQPANGVALCRACHEWVHAHPYEARQSGWLLSKWGGMADATPIRPLAGEPWWLADDGTRYTRADLIGA